MNYYKVQSTYFLIFIVLGSFAIAILPNVLNMFSGISDDFAISKMQYIQAEMVLHKTKGESFHQACTTGFLSSVIYEVERDVYCRSNIDGDQMIAFIVLENGFYYVIDSLGITCTLPTLPKQNSVNCKTAA